MSDLASTMLQFQNKLKKVLNKNTSTDNKLLTDNSRKGLIKCSKLIKDALQNVPQSCKVSSFLLQPDLADQLIADIQSAEDCPTNKNALETALWRRVRRISDALPNLAETHKKKNKKSNGNIETEETEGSFRDYFKNVYTGSFGKDLEKMREEEEGGFDDRKVSMLIDCMEVGMQQYDTLEKRLAVELKDCAFVVPTLRGGKKRKLDEPEEEGDGGDGDKPQKSLKKSKKDKKKKESSSSSSSDTTSSSSSSSSSSDGSLTESTPKKKKKEKKEKGAEEEAEVVKSSKKSKKKEKKDKSEETVAEVESIKKKKKSKKKT